MAGSSADLASSTEQEMDCSDIMSKEYIRNTILMQEDIFKLHVQFITDYARALTHVVIIVGTYACNLLPIPAGKGATSAILHAEGANSEESEQKER